ncbi:hypothetical protein FA95DRAFT_1611546 [Auriscalpium vulgare]|uniref:Uncharacterized protein n=1 Tax=Auriscalpium vulgare TaxID=40419 RepID=A0ACB8R9J1_9AGAM|nr:hypothetical protein FA95DRAFT_1611546 [Auriscalpium vulgare]
MPIVRVYPDAIMIGYVRIAALLCSLRSAKVEPVQATLRTGLQVHDTIATIKEVNGSSHDFLICFLYSPDLPVNHAVMRLYPGFNWRGELLVMRMSPSSPHSFVTNMGGRVFADLAEEAVIAFLKLARLLQSQGKLIPDSLPTHFYHQLDETSMQTEDQLEN